MLRSIVICPDPELSAKLAQSLEVIGGVKVLRTVPDYPAPEDLVRILRANAAEVLFLSFECIEEAFAAVRIIEQESSCVQIVAVNRTMDPQILRDGMRAGVRDFLVDPFERGALRDSLTHLKDLLERRPARYETTNQIFTFVPSKAGAGTSTIALNVGAAMARQEKMRVLLADFDLNSGMMRFLLKLDNPHSVPEACEHCAELDDNLWPQLVTHVNGLDVLHAGRINPKLRIEPAQVRTLIAFVRRNYQALCFDVSGNMERHSIELMQESKSILLVCTPEIASLHQAREKMMFLTELGLETRVSVVLNRVSRKQLMSTKQPMSTKQVAELVGAPVARTFPNDYDGVGEALANGTLVATGSELGKAYHEFAESLLASESQAASRQSGTKRKFLDFLQIPSEAGLVRDN